MVPAVREDREALVGRVARAAEVEAVVRPWTPAERTALEPMRAWMVPAERGWMLRRATTPMTREGSLEREVTSASAAKAATSAQVAASAETTPGPKPEAREDKASPATIERPVPDRRAAPVTCKAAARAVWRRHMAPTLGGLSPPSL